MSILETDIVQGEVRYRDSDHSYIHVPTGKKLTAVSDVIRTVYSTKSWDGVNEDVVEAARIRGAAVDKYMAEYIRSFAVTIDSEESRDVANRVQVACRIWEEEFSGLPAEAQRIVYSIADGIAGTMDFWVNDDTVVDLKSTYSVERSWILQLGAYADMAPALAMRAGIIHISPKVYPKGGVWMEYDVNACQIYWRKAVEWWKQANGMAKEVKVSRRKN